MVLYESAWFLLIKMVLLTIWFHGSMQVHESGTYKTRGTFYQLEIHTHGKTVYEPWTLITRGTFYEPWTMDPQNQTMNQ